ncbi:peptidase domain-containing ABC transporter [Niabella yanshanensis]|uniref:Peptidase domain-containing ABC transporter n=1 Tax=Niabella yanshanensis TaxID=577386 RepID=A0ABZ0W630_9BACT|nr:peptidase domain-containing ABC transporter [Niabella yanshanensis]WQD37480.1 peptidase domain-containing ABC transporter [Niabella yanshanensis]
MRKEIKIKQRDVTDCGAACLASIAAHYKLRLPVSRIRQFAGTDKRGTNVLGLIEAAEKLGFQAKGAKGPFESLFKIPLPAIAHLQLKNQLYHYVVIYKTTQNYILVMDPADGKLYRHTHEAFKEIWTGVIVLIVPGESFTTGNEKVSNIKRFWQLIQPHSAIMLQAVIGAAIYTILGLSTSIYMQKIIDFVLVEGNLRLLNLLSVAMIAILVFQLLIGFYKSLFALQTGQQIDAKLILGYYKHLLKLPQRFFDTMRVGEIISRVNDAVKIRMFVNDVSLSLVVNVLIIGFSISLMFMYYWKLAAIMLLIIPIYALLYFISNKINKKWQRTLMEDSAELETQLVESLTAAGTIKRLGLESYANEKTENRFYKLLQTIYRTSVYSLYTGNAIEFFTRLFTIVLLWAGSYFVVKGELSPGELLSFYALIGYLTGPAASLIGANKNIQDALIAADRLFEIIDLETETNNDNKVNITPELTGNILFDNVSFRYGTRTQVFTNLSLAIEKGKSTAIVGQSGSGKSTLMSLLQNLYPVKEGRITIGDFELDHISNKSLRQLIGVVPQHIDLFAGTIIENIAIGDYEPDMQKILFLSKLTGVNDFIEKLPANYHTTLNEQGVNLSGGQRQRLAIVRALYRNPEILILDEATSSLDPASETQTQRALQWFQQQGKTLIIIAHRLSTIRSCDKILVIQSGTLVESGAHEELMLANGVYASLWKFHTGSTDL